MTAQLSNFLVQKLLNQLVGGVSYTFPTTLYLSAHNSAGTEVTGGSYARIVLTCNTTNWPAISGSTRAITLAIAQNFATATSDWLSDAEVNQLGLYDAPAGGNQLALFPVGGTPQNAWGYASTGTFTCQAHGYTSGQRIQFQTLANANLPGGISALTTYYVINPTTNTFQVSLTNGGSAVTISADGGVVVYSYNGQIVYSGNTFQIQANGLTLTIS
jgi:hypothetical protein